MWYPQQKPNANQTKEQTVDLIFPYNGSSVDWKTIEKQDDKLKQEFIAHHPANFNDSYNGYMHPGSEIRAEPVKLKNAIHIIDVNGNGKNDIVYEGSGGWETNKVFIFLNTAEGFKRIFYDWQYVAKLEFKDNKLWRLYTYNPGCCADYMVFNKIFEFDFINYPHFFKEIYSTSYYKHTQLSKSYLDKPIKFSVLEDSCKLRTEPQIGDRDSLILFGSNVHMGNDAGRIAKGAIGRAIATQADTRGNVWWLVEMDLHAKISGDVFYNEMSENDLSGKVGWINGKAAKVIE